MDVIVIGGNNYNHKDERAISEGWIFNHEIPDK